MPTRDEKNKFSTMIEERAQILKISHLEMITDYCSKSGMEMETAASLINAELKAKIQVEAIAQHSIKKKHVTI